MSAPLPSRRAVATPEMSVATAVSIREKGLRAARGAGSAGFPMGKTGGRNGGLTMLSCMARVVVVNFSRESPALSWGQGHQPMARVRLTQGEGNRVSSSFRGRWTFTNMEGR